MLRALAKRLSCLRREDDGQAIIFGAFGMLVVVMFMLLVFEVGRTGARRIQMQNAADAGAYSGALVKADALASLAYLNNGMAWMWYRSCRHATDTIIADTMRTMYEYNLPDPGTWFGIIPNYHVNDSKVLAQFQIHTCKVVVPPPKFLASVPGDFWFWGGNQQSIGVDEGPSDPGWLKQFGRLGVHMNDFGSQVGYNNTAQVRADARTAYEQWYSPNGANNARYASGWLQTLSQAQDEIVNNAANEIRDEALLVAFLNLDSSYRSDARVAVYPSNNAELFSVNGVSWNSGYDKYIQPHAGSFHDPTGFLSPLHWPIGPADDWDTDWFDTKTGRWTDNFWKTRFKYNRAQSRCIARFFMCSFPFNRWNVQYGTFGWWGTSAPWVSLYASHSNSWSGGLVNVLFNHPRGAGGDVPDTFHHRVNPPPSFYLANTNTFAKAVSVGVWAPGVDSTWLPKTARTGSFSFLQSGPRDGVFYNPPSGYLTVASANAGFFTRSGASSTYMTFNLDGQSANLNNWVNGNVALVNDGDLVDATPENLFVTDWNARLVPVRNADGTNSAHTVLNGLVSGNWNRYVAGFTFGSWIPWGANLANVRSSNNLSDSGSNQPWNLNGANINDAVLH